MADVAIAEITATIQRLALLAYVDERTGLENRNALKQEMHAFASSPHAVMFVDLAGFKEINDKYSHEAGDAALRHVGTALLTLAKKHDAKVYRYGGDEFVTVVPVQRADVLADDAFASLSAMSFRYEEQTLTVGATLGLCVPSAPEHIELLIQRAEKACAVGKFDLHGAVTRWRPQLESIKLESHRKRCDRCKATTTVLHRVHPSSLHAPRDCGSCGASFATSVAAESWTTRTTRKIQDLSRRVQRAVRAGSRAFSDSDGIRPGQPTDQP